MADLVHVRRGVSGLAADVDDRLVGRVGNGLRGVAQVRGR